MLFICDISIEVFMDFENNLTLGLGNYFNEEFSRQKDYYCETEI